MIMSDSPIVVPPTPQVAFDTWWVTSIVIEAADPNGAISARIGYRLVRLDQPSGQYIPYLDAGGQPLEVLLNLPDLVALDKAQPAIGILGLINSVSVAAGLIGKAQGTIQ